jgi:hypothetical protein
MSGFGDLMLGTQATGANVDVFSFAVDVDSGRVDIGRPAPVGATFGVANMMAELRCFTANITLQFLLTP